MWEGKSWILRVEEREYDGTIADRVSNAQIEG